MQMRILPAWKIPLELHLAPADAVLRPRLRGLPSLARFLHPLKQFFLFPRHSRHLLNRHIRFRCAVSISFHLRENWHSSALAGNRLHRKGLPCKAFFYLPFLLERFRNNNLFFPCRFFLCFPFPVGRKRNLHNLLPVIQRIRDHITHLAVNLLLMGKTKLHLRRMHH